MPAFLYYNNYYALSMCCFQWAGQVGLAQLIVPVAHSTLLGSVNLRLSRMLKAKILILTF